MNLGIRRTVAPLIACVALASACDDDPSGPDVLTAPAQLTVSATGPTSATVTFAAVSGATGYLVQRSAAGGAFQEAGTTATTAFEDTGLQPETQYSYRVAATRQGSTGPFSSSAAVTTPQEGPKVATISSDITADRTLRSDTLYTLSGFVHVTNGATLTIEAGTVIHGDYDVVGSSLFVLRGARIRALGTADAPVVFTSSRPVGQRRPGDWGGLILVGNGVINRGQPVILEGTGTGPTNPQIDYSGGTDNADDSGELRYVRIEFAGYATAPDAELNSLTLAAVGSGTTIEYVQSLAGLDDSFEWFGGAVDAKHLVTYESGDDHFDMSEGYTGRVQFAIAYQSKVLDPRPQAGNVSNDPQGIENDGCAGANCLSGQESQPYTAPLLANFTLVGTGPGTPVDGTSGGIGMMIRRGTAGTYVNGIVARWPRAAISLRDQSTKDRIEAGDLVLRNLLLASNGAVFQPQSGGTVQSEVDQGANAIEANANSAASLFNSLPADPGSAAQIDWTPAAGSPAASGGLVSFSGALATKAGGFVQGTAYRGAADPNGPKWWEGWTSYADN